MVRVSRAAARGAGVGRCRAGRVGPGGRSPGAGRGERGAARTPAALRGAAANAGHGRVGGRYSISQAVTQTVTQHGLSGGLCPCNKEWLSHVLAAALQNYTA